MFAKELGIDPIRLAQLHDAEKRRLLEGNRVQNELQDEAMEEQQHGDDVDSYRRTQRAKEHHRDQVVGNENLREKYGVAGGE